MADNAASGTSESNWNSFAGTSPTANLFSATATQKQKNDDTSAAVPKVPKIYELDSVKKTIVLDELAIKMN